MIIFLIASLFFRYNFKKIIAYMYFFGIFRMRYVIVFLLDREKSCNFVSLTFNNYKNKKLWVNLERIGQFYCSFCLAFVW